MITWWKKPKWVDMPSAENLRLDGKNGHSKSGKVFESTLQYPTTPLGQLLDQSAQRFGNTDAIVYCDQRWTYAQLLKDANRLAAGLALQGVFKGDRVLMTLPNCPEFIICFMAVQKLGGIVVNAGPLLGGDDLQQLVAMTTPKLIIAIDLQFPMISGCCQRNTDVNWLSVSLKDYQPIWKRLGYRAKLMQARGGESGHAEGMTVNGGSGYSMRLEELLAHSPARPPSVVPGLDDTAVLQPTGGTSGTLKVAILSHRNLLANVTQLSTLIRLRPGQDRILSVLPMFHVYGLSTCLFTAIFNAATMLPLTRFRVNDMLDVICRHKPTILPLAPAIIEPMCKALESGPEKRTIEVIAALQSTIITSGAAPLLPKTSHRFCELTGVQIAQGYGLTEASPVTHANPIDTPRVGSIGLPLPDTQVRLGDLDQNDEDMSAVGDNTTGELLVCGPQVMSGYIDNPEETQRMISFDEHGQKWLHTGDIVRVDPDGFYYVIDRRKDMINRGGLKVYPRQVENVLKTHDRVVDAAVIGRDDPVQTQIVVAMVVTGKPVDDREELVASLRRLCRDHLAPYAVPEVIDFVTDLPHTALGKLQKYRLRENTKSPAEDKMSSGSDQDMHVAKDLH